MPKGLTNWARCPLARRRTPTSSKNIRREGFETTSMAESTGRSLRYFKVAHIRLRDSGTAAHSSGEGVLAEPRVTEDMKPLQTMSFTLTGEK